MIALKIIFWIIVTGIIALFIRVWLFPKIMFFYYGVRMWLMSFQYDGELKKDLKEAANEFFKYSFNWKILPEEEEETRKNKQLKLMDKLLAYETQEECDFQVRINAVEEVTVEGNFGKNFNFMVVKMKPAESDDKPFEIMNSICYDLKGPLMKVLDKGEDNKYTLQIFTNNPNDCIDPKYFEKGTLWFTHPSYNRPPSEQ